MSANAKENFSEELWLVFPLTFESAALRRSLLLTTWPRNLRVFHCGMGAQNVRHFVQTISTWPSRILLAGFCGGLHPLAQVGALFEATISINSHHPSDPAAFLQPWCGLSGQLFPPRSLSLIPYPGQLVSRPQAVASAEEKAALHAAPPFPAVVDMETLYFLTAIEQAIECASSTASPHFLTIEIIRVVSDGPNDHLPLSAALLEPEQGHPPFALSLVVALMGEPYRLPGLVKLARKSWQARGILTQRILAKLQLWRSPRRSPAQ